jgi:PIN domain nuclease of toxin-antitoxin system
VKLLLDTHAFLWWDADAEQLPSSLVKTLQDPTHEITLSVVSAWEMQIKAALGKLELQTPLSTLIGEQREKNGIGVLPVSLQHVLALENLGDYHKDPFDRLLIAQAKVEGLTLVSKDEAFRHYDVPLFWG